ncbi:unnamed protein product [Ceratitis capitata]|uniref:(Mediterranean fruit fly) hypothetical protein n=1 Tax=Ceratitis capitata TaxID=7213 RepID=A0A811VHK4_CERCA|nr:unnamed protein product [Ceratitis capitata]
MSGLYTCIYIHAYKCLPAHTNIKTCKTQPECPIDGLKDSHVVWPTFLPQQQENIGNVNSMPSAASSSGRGDKLLQNSHSNNSESSYSSSNNKSASFNNYNNNNNKVSGNSSKESNGKESMMVMTTNAISHRNTNYNNNNNNNSSVNNGKNSKCKVVVSSAATAAAAAAGSNNTKAINTNISSNNNNSVSNTSSSHTTKSMQNYANSNDGYASLVVASDVDCSGHAPFRVAHQATQNKLIAIPTATTKAPTKASNTSTSAPGAAVRVKKPSTSSTITTTTIASSISSEHDEESSASASNTRKGGTSKVNQTSKGSASKLAQSGSVERRGRTSSHQSHYSTDKSGSSGYYSSNVCSTYSLDEHIYCEPVVDILDVNRGSGVSTATTAASKTSKSAATLESKKAANSESNKNNKQTPLDMTSKQGGGASKCFYVRRSVVGAAASRNGESGIADCSELEGEDDCDGDGAKKARAMARLVNSNGHRKANVDLHTSGTKIPASLQFLLQRQTSDDNYPPSQHFSENLRILETSIENLDRHLKNFPSITSHERIAAFVQSHHQHLHQQHHHAYLQTPIGESIGSEKLAARTQQPPQTSHQQLPTIMEGYDPTIQPHRPWPDEIVDDSLLDIDLDSFLLVNERKTAADGKSARKSSTIPEVGGIDNPTFLTEEQEEENNYKCAKYINSCPDDAYHVESDIVTGTGTVSEKSVSVGDHYMKRYEDQLHFQSTRELLEDVRDKIRLLSQTGNSNSPSSHGAGGQFSLAAPTEQLPRELEGMINTLKSELENYLDRMNQHSELEIRQLCSGLVRNHNIVKMKKAFERRRSTHSLGTIESDYGYLGNYEAICNGVPTSIREQIVSIRCVSDPNFKMKRKSLTEVFPVSDCYTESDTLAAVQQQQRRPSIPRRERDNAEHRQREHDRNVITLHVPTSLLQRNLSFQQPVLNKLDAKSLPTPMTDAEVSGEGNNAKSSEGGGGGNGCGAESGESGDKETILEWHRKKPSIWEMYYGTNRMNQSLLGKRNGMVTNNNSQVTMSYPSSRPESDFTLDLPRAEQLRIKMEKEKKFRQRCRYITTFLSLVFFLLTVMVVSLVLTRGKRMFGSMI